MNTFRRGRYVAMLSALTLIVAALPFAPAALAATRTVELEPVSGARLFAPQNLGSINAGDTILWQNRNGTHDVTSANIPAGAAAWASGLLSGSATYSRTFTVAGNYRYYCSLHASVSEANATPQDASKMVGQFTVVADTTAPDAPTAFAASGVSGSQINLAWTPSSSTDVAQQEIYRNTTNSRGSASLVATYANNTQASHSDTGLTAATAYYYWLEAIDGAGNRSLPAAANASTSSVNAQVNTSQTLIFDVSSTLQLSVTPASLDLGSISPAQPTDTAVGATVANVKSNAGWSLMVKAVGANGIDDTPGDDGVMTSGSNTIPISRLGWRINPSAVDGGSSAYASMTDLNAAIGSSASGTSAAGTDLYLQYRLSIQFSDPVALNYQTVLLFTATSP